MFDAIINNNLFSIFLGVLILLDFLLSKRFNFSLDNFNKINFVFILLFFLILVNSYLVRKQFMFGAIFNLIVSYIIAIKINNFKVAPWVLLIPFWFLMIFVLFRLSINPDPAKVFINSRNYVSFYLIITVLPYYYLTFKDSKKYSVIPAILTLAISLYSLGRSGIAASLLILISVLYPKFKKGVFTRIISVFIVVTIGYFFIDFLGSNDSSKEIERFTKLDSFLSDQGRGSIISLYLEKADWTVFLFGMDTNLSLREELSTYGHVHSSLLNFHSVVGIGSFVVLYTLFIRMKFFLKFNIPLLLLLLSVLVRFSTDVGALFGYFDYVVWIFLFSYMVNEIKF